MGGIFKKTHEILSAIARRSHYASVSCDQNGTQCQVSDHWGASPAFHMSGSVGFAPYGGPVMESAVPACAPAVAAVIGQSRYATQQSQPNLRKHPHFAAAEFL